MHQYLSRINMTNYEIYKNVFISIFNAPEIEKLKFGSPGWDSAGHLILITELEKAFNITFKIEDILNFKSFEAGVIILKKYNIKMQMSDCEVEV